MGEDMSDDGREQTGHERVPSRQRRRFPGISSRAYEHPADRSALVALRKLSGFDTVFKALSGLLPERSLRLLFLSDSVRVSGHSVYRTILLFLTSLALRVAWIPLGNIAIMAIVTALREWFRKSELSADRAGLLVGQDPQASMRGLMKLAGGNHLHEMNVDAFLEQAEEYEAGGDLRDSVLKILNVLPRSHPFTTVRAAELKKWAESRDYQRIMDGHYPRRSEDKDTSVTDSFRESAASYAGHVKSSKDPLMKLVSDIAGGAGGIG